ncbi:MAG: substrate-binding domain-containing protein [Bacteroidia bacterium]|nr:substrate-binding domain-containing protein [Bacteroidia bacterium]
MRICNRLIEVFINNIQLPIKFIFLLIIAGCYQGTDRLDETPTRGNIKISVDESYQLLLDTEIYTFQSLYPYAKINAQYKPEYEIYTDFFNDSVRAIVTNRKLTKDEEDALKSNSIIPRTTLIAYDALALIINNKNPDTTMRFDQVQDIFTGKITVWKQINVQSPLTNIFVVFDNEKSGNVRYFQERFSIGVNFPSNFGAVKTNPEVINYVEKNINALGIISVNWISDKDDTLSLSFLKRIKVVAICSPLDADGSDYYYRPYQGYIAEKSYPFIREVYMISREHFSGLGSGFISFVASDPGQRIILKSGLVPAIAPVRLIQIKDHF